MGWHLWLSTLVGVRLICAMTSPIMDCDETFNYLEPLHYTLYHEGMQPWEYSPLFALRSWCYIHIHHLLIKPFVDLKVSPYTIFFVLRALLGVLCAFCESYFLLGIQRKFRNRVVTQLTFLFLCCNSGMYHSSVAFIPSSFCMFAVMLGYGLWFLQRNLEALVVGAFAFTTWPYVLIMFAPIALEYLWSRGLKVTLGHAIAVVLICIGIPSIVDSRYYGRLVMPSLNQILYNVYSDGTNLYGKEPAHFYIVNLLLNFNIITNLALVSPFLFVLCPVVKEKDVVQEEMDKAMKELDAKPKNENKKQKSDKNENEKNRKKNNGKNDESDDVVEFVGLLELCSVLCGMYCWIGISSMQPHKEERFLAFVYPILCLSAAISLESTKQICNLLKFPAALIKYTLAMIVLACIMLCGSRSYALHHNYRAPMELFEYLQDYNTTQYNTICIGKEWYRFPSSFMLPRNKNSEGEEEIMKLLWIRDGFSGLLPQPFKQYPKGFTHISETLNDKNKDEPSAYSTEEACDLLIDFSLDTENGRMLNDWENWEPVKCIPFLDSESSKAIFRSFYIPFGGSKRFNVYRDYCLLKRKE